MKRIFCILVSIALALACGGDLCAQKKDRTPMKMGGMMHQRDSSKHSGRILDQRLFLPKGSLSVGLQFSYFDFSGSDSDFMLLVQDMNAYAGYFSIAPSFSYMLSDNKALGLRIKYSNASAGISEADLSLLSDDLSLEVKDVSGISNGIQSEVFYRSYIGLDDHGRFGLFSDLALQYTHTKTSFSTDSDSMNAYTLGNKIKLAVRPGMEVFVMNNISTQVSIGIGGVSYSNTKYIKGDEVVGTKDSSRARFMLDVTDISMGLSLHF